MESYQDQDNSVQELYASNPSTNSSYQNVTEVLRFEKAVVRIDRDLRDSQDSGQILPYVLHRRLSTRLNEAGVTPEIIPERVSVIAHTPARSPRTSSPSSPSSRLPPPPQPPRQCQTIGQFVLPIYSRCSSPCSDLSSISVFRTSESGCK